MTSQGMHPDSYLLVVEDAEVMTPNVTGSTEPPHPLRCGLPAV